MRLSNDGLEIETEGTNISFPTDLIIVNWSCNAVEKWDDEFNKYYEFYNYEFMAFLCTEDNEPELFRTNIDQHNFIEEKIETDAEKELQKQK